MLARGFGLLCFCGLFGLMVCGFNCGLGGWFARAVWFLWLGLFSGLPVACFLVGCCYVCGCLLWAVVAALLGCDCGIPV